MSRRLLHRSETEQLLQYAARPETANAVTIGAADADILFAGLHTRLHQPLSDQSASPLGAPAGTDVPLVIAVAGRQSGVVTMAVEQTTGERVIGGEQ